MAGDFARTYDEHVWSVFGYFAYRVRDRGDAEDLTQMTFERALKAWPRYDRRRASAGTWLLAIAHNLLVDHYRADRSGRHEPLDDRPEHELGSVLADPDLGIDGELATALSRLSERDRQVVALRYGGDLTGPEIASLLDLSLANVQQILSRSLRRMREELDAPASP